MANKIEDAVERLTEEQKKSLCAIQLETMQDRAKTLMVHIAGATMADREELPRGSSVDEIDDYFERVKSRMKSYGIWKDKYQEAYDEAKKTGNPIVALRL